MELGGAVGMEQPPDPQHRLGTIASVLRSGGSAPVVSVRSFLQWFDAQRRGYYIVKGIRRALAEAGIRTKPDFEPVYIDSEISFVLDQPSEVDATQPREITVALSETLSVTDGVEAVVVGATFADPTHRMSKLAAANRTPVSVSPDATLSEAVTVMMANDFSQ